MKLELLRTVKPYFSMTPKQSIFEVEGYIHVVCSVCTTLSNHVFGQHGQVSIPQYTIHAKILPNMDSPGTT